MKENGAGFKLETSSEIFSLPHVLFNSYHVEWTQIVKRAEGQGLGIKSGREAAEDQTMGEVRLILPGLIFTWRAL